jgi:hypothetical protein
MKKSRYTEDQIAFALKQAELGTKVEEVCRQTWPRRDRRALQAPVQRLQVFLERAAALRIPARIPRAAQAIQSQVTSIVSGPPAGCSLV